MKVNLDGSKLGGLFAAVQQKQDLPGKYLSVMPMLQHPKMNRLLVKPLQRWCHVISVNQQALVWLRHLLGFDPFNLWQTQTGLFIKLV